MARQDMDIKGDVISELEDIVDPHLGSNLLDALIVEELRVERGEVTLTLVYDNDRPASERDSLQADIADALADIEDIGPIHFAVQARDALGYKRLSELQDAEDEPEARAAEPQAGLPGALTLGQLIANTAPEQEAADAELQTLNINSAETAPTSPDAGSRVGLYSGGGCAAGTTLPQTSSSTPSAATPAPAAERSPSARSAAPPDVAPVQGDGLITVPRADWEALLLARQSLEDRAQAQEQRIAALQNALRAMIDEV